MKIHFAEFENYGDYESPSYGTDQTLCGCTGEIPCKNATNAWGEVTCKKCLKLKDNYIKSCKEDEEIICKQMGEMADFFQNESEGL